MLLKISKNVDKNLGKLRKYKNNGPFEYIANMKQNLAKKCTPLNFEHFLSLDNIQETLEVSLSARLMEILSKV